jgi:hypothetical protein
MAIPYREVKLRVGELSPLVVSDTYCKLVPEVTPDVVLWVLAVEGVAEELSEVLGGWVAGGAFGRLGSLTRSVGSDSSPDSPLLAQPVVLDVVP